MTSALSIVSRPPPGNHRTACASELNFRHRQQWDFKVRITENIAGPAAHECASAQSVPESFYSTQAVAEDLGVSKGRALVEGM